MANPNVADVFKLELENSFQLMETLRKDRDQLRNELEQQRRHAEVAAEQKNEQIRELIKERNRFKDDLNMWKAREESQKMSLDHLIKQNTQLFQQIRELKDEREIQLTKHREEVKQIRTKHSQQVRDLRDEQKLQLNSHHEELRQSRAQFCELQSLVQSFREEAIRSNEEMEKSRKLDEERNITELLHLREFIEEKHVNSNSYSTRLQAKVEQIHDYLEQNVPGKFVLINHYTELPQCFASGSVECINYECYDLSNLTNPITSYKKQLLMILNCGKLTASRNSDYGKLLSLCQRWKKSVPNGTIHCLYWHRLGENPPEVSKDLLLDSIHAFQNSFSWFTNTPDIEAIRRYWPTYAKKILLSEGQ